jgi:hypothetical protein
MDAVAIWKVIIMSRDGPRGSCGEKVLHCQIFIVSYLQFVERKHLAMELQQWQVNYTGGCP